MPISKYGKKYYQIEFQCPGYGRGRWKCSTGTTSKSIAQTYEAKLRELYQEGQFKALDWVRDKKLPLAKLRSLSGVREVIQYIEREERKAREDASELTRLLAEFIADPNRTAADSTYANYDTQAGWYIRWMDERLNGPTPAASTSRRGPVKKQVPVTAMHLTTENISKWLRVVEEAPSERYADKRGRKPKTVMHHRAAVSAFCSFLIKKGILESNPAEESYQPKVPKTDPVYMNRRQWPVFRKYSLEYDADRVARWELLPKEDHTRPYPCTLFWDFLVATGATTYNEGCRVRMADVYLSEEPNAPDVRVWLAGTKSDNRPRDVFISRDLALRLAEFAKTHGRGTFEPIFPWGKNEGHHAWTQIKKAMMQDGHDFIKPMKAYDLRHTYAVNMIQGDPERNIPGVDIVTLARLMGHGDNIQTTMIYAKHFGDYARRGCMVLHRVLGL